MTTARRWPASRCSSAPRFGFGALCIFLYVGAEVSIGSLIVNYLMQKDVLGTTAEAAGKMVAFYWGGAMVGRFIGSYFLRMISPGKILATLATGAIVLIADLGQHDRHDVGL